MTSKSMRRKYSTSCCVAIEIRTRLSSQLLNRRAENVRQCLVGQNEAALTVFGKDEVRVDINHLPQESRCSLIASAICFRSVTSRNIAVTNLPS